MAGCKGMRTYPNIISFHTGLLAVANSESLVWATDSEKLSRYLPNFNFQSVCLWEHINAGDNTAFVSISLLEEKSIYFRLKCVAYLNYKLISTFINKLHSLLCAL